VQKEVEGSDYVGKGSSGWRGVKKDESGTGLGLRMSLAVTFGGFSEALSLGVGVLRGRVDYTLQVRSEEYMLFYSGS
jgi:hypothetical protein